MKHAHHVRQPKTRGDERIFPKSFNTSGRIMSARARCLCLSPRDLCLMALRRRHLGCGAAAEGSAGTFMHLDGSWLHRTPDGSKCMQRHSGSIAEGECRCARREDERRVTPTRATTCHTKTCASLLGKDTKAGKGAGKKGPNGSGTWHREKGADEWPSGRRDDGGKTGSKGSKPEWYSGKDKGRKGRVRWQECNPILLRLRRAGTHRGKLSVQVGQQHG